MKPNQGEGLEFLEPKKAYSFGVHWNLQVFK